MRIFIVSLAVAALSQGVVAQKVTSPVLTDAQFVMKAAQGGHAEAEAGQLGISKAANDRVRAFAQRMVTDHAAGNDELAGLAASRNITVKPEPGAALIALEGRSAGAQFDCAYMHQIVRNHEETLELFDWESQNGTDAELRAWAASQLPALRAHLREAREIYSRAYRIAYAARQAMKQGSR